MKATETKIKRRRCSKAIVLDNCTLLKDLRVLLPEELFFLEDILKADFKNLESLYRRFFEIQDFTKDLTVKFHLKGRLTKGGDFDCVSSRTGLPVINIYAVQHKICDGTEGAVLAHEMAHFIDWRLCNINGEWGNRTSKKDSEESKLAQVFNSFQEVAPPGIPFGGSSSKDMNSNCELFARYLEEYYDFCIHRERFENRYALKKNSSYVKATDFEKSLLQPIREYLNSSCERAGQKTITIEGNLYSEDKKTLIKYNDDGRQEFFVPDEVETIGKWAFYECKNLAFVHLGKNTQFILDYAFTSCAALQSVCGGHNVRLIGSCAFGMCFNLAEVKDLDSLAYISNLAFARCNNLRDFDFSDSIQIIEKSAFRACAQLDLRSAEHLFFAVL